MIELFNKWFHLFNTQHKYDKVSKGFGLDYESQEHIMTTFNKNMRIHDKNTLLPFQKGLFIQIGIMSNKNEYKFVLIYTL